MKTKSLLIIFILLISGLFLSGCTSSNSTYRSSYYGDDSYYEDYEDEPVTSDNWDCTSDCSGHEAGYEWAEDNDITDSSDCGGNSDSFIEGCEAYANEYQQEEYEQESYDDYENDYYY